MMEASLLWLLLIIPAAGGAGCLLLSSARAVLAVVPAVVAVMTAVAAGLAVWSVFSRGPIATGGGWLYLDALSAYHLLLLQMVFCLSSVYARSYFAHEQRHGGFSPDSARRFGALWLGSLAAMALVLVSNNLGIVWVGIEATTLLTAFLICLHASPGSLEAMWKYLIMCSVGVAFAFIGTLLIAASASSHLQASDALLWTRLRDVAGSLDARLLKTGFIFLLVGYGTKAGLAPMHNWLPDAHSQAPAPVSAVFSGFLLNAALYCILRCLPLVEAATGQSGWGMGLLVVFGSVSILIAAAFILFQSDAKRLLAYSSVEHMGIVALGAGLGGLGTFAAMFHVLNHSLCKPTAFFSAGKLGQLYGNHDLSRMSGAMGRSPVWGGAFFLSLLGIIGVAPFAIFMSEFGILKAATDNGAIEALCIFLLGTAIVFVAVLRHAIATAWGGRGDDAIAADSTPARASLAEKALVVLPLAALLVLGVWMPPALRLMLEQASNIIRGGL